MNRRKALSGLAVAGGALLTGCRPIQEKMPKAPVLGAIPLSLEKPIQIDATSKPVQMKSGPRPIVSIGEATFTLDASFHLTAVLHADVAQYARVDYWISGAVFDSAGRFLGAANQKEEVEFISLGFMLTKVSEIELDFGISNAFKQAAFLTVAISECDVPKQS